MNILIVTEYYTPHVGGVETLFNSIAKKATECGNVVHIVTMQLPSTKNEEIIDGINIHRIKVPLKASRHWFVLLSLPKLWEITNKIDIIQTTTWAAALPSWIVGKLRKIPCVITIHEVNKPIWQYFNFKGIDLIIAKLYENILFKLSFDRYIAVSYYTKNCILQYFNVDSSLVNVIYNGIDIQLFDPAKHDGKKVRNELNLNKNQLVFLFFGRPGLTKGVEYLVEAAPLIETKIPNFKLILILAHDPIENYKNVIHLVNKVNRDNIIILNPVPRTDLPDYIAAADLVIVPSLSEGFGFSVAEACAMKKPIVATNVAAIPEVVSGKYVLVEPRNPQAIADGVESIYNCEITDRDNKVFSNDNCVISYMACYKEVIATKVYRTNW